MVTTLLAITITLLGDIARAPDNSETYRQLVAQIYDDALADPLKEVKDASADLQSLKAANAPSPLIKAARERLSLAKDTVRLTKIKWKNWPPPISEISLWGGSGVSSELPYGRLRSKIEWKIRMPGRGYYPERTKRWKKKTRKLRFVVVKVLGPYSMEVEERYVGGGVTFRPAFPVRINGLPTLGAVTEVSEINIGGKFFEVSWLPISPGSIFKTRVLRFLR